MPKVFIVKSVTLNVARKVTMKIIYAQQSIEIERFRTISPQKMPNIFANVEKDIKPETVCGIIKRSVRT